MFSFELLKITREINYTNATKQSSKNKDMYILSGSLLCHGMFLKTITVIIMASPICIINIVVVLD